MKSLKLDSSEKLAARVVGYVAFIEQHRSAMKDVGGNSKQTLADLDDQARNLKLLIEKVDKAETAFTTLRSELKARMAELDSALTEQLSYSREYAKHHKLTVIREGLKPFGHLRSRKRGGSAPSSKEAKPAS